MHQESKTTFYLGLSIGISVISTIGFLTLLLGGADGIGGSSGKVAGATVNSGGTLAPSPSAPAPSGSNAGASAGGIISDVTDQDHIRGNPNAAISLVEFSDFECPFCGRLHPTLQQLLTQYDGQINLVYRHFPLTSIHPNAQKSAEASECAAEQGKFWEYHDILFENQTALRVDNLKSYAGQLGLSQSQFDSCLDTGKYASKVAEHQREGQAAGVTGTPGTFVNGQLVRGAVPITTFQQIIESSL